MAKKELDQQALDDKAAKMKALMAAMGKIEKDFGKGAVMKLGDEKVDDIEVIPTGSIALEYALGVGG